jgi:ATP-binding cassette subfamily C protein
MAEPSLQSLLRLLRDYLAVLWSYGHRRLVLALVVLLLVAGTDGIGLLLLVPLLELVGLTANGTVPSGISANAERIFAALGIPLELTVILCIYVALVSGRALLIRWREVLLTTIRFGFVDYLRIRLYTAIGRAHWLFLARQRSADLNHVLTTDIGRVGVGTYFLLELSVATGMVLVYIAVALRLSALVTLLALVAGGGLLAILWPQIRRARQLGEMLTEANREVFSTTSQFLDGIKLAKSYGAEARHTQAFTAAVITLRQRVLDFTRSNASAQAIFQIGAALLLSGLLYLAAAVIRLPAAELLVLVLIFSRLLPLLSQAQRHYQQLVHALPAFAAAQRLESACMAAAEPLPAPGDTPLSLIRDIRLQSIHFRYDPQQSREALAGIDLRIPARRTTALVGPSGAGKSTLADLLMGLLTPTAGKLLVDGKPLQEHCIHAWRRAVAYVPQETFLFHDTVRANLQWAQPAATDQELWDVLRLAAAENFVTQLPQGLDTVVGERGVRLSGGERQRLALARALLRRPALLLLDEATSALDSENEQRIQQAIEGLHGELTIVVIAHRLSTVRRADQIVVLEGGRVVEWGQWAELSGSQESRLCTMLRTG